MIDFGWISTSKVTHAKVITMINCWVCWRHIIPSFLTGFIWLFQFALGIKHRIDLRRHYLHLIKETELWCNVVNSGKNIGPFWQDVCDEQSNTDQSTVLIYDGSRFPWVFQLIRSLQLNLWIPLRNQNVITVSLRWDFSYWYHFPQHTKITVN